MRIKASLPVLTLIAALQTSAQTTIALTEDEINTHKKPETRQFYGGKFYTRDYTPVPGDELRKQMTPHKSVKWAFCEALTNTVVRYLTRRLRLNRNNKPENKILSWEANRKNFIFKYKAFMKSGMLKREECTLKFTRIAVLRTLNGKMRIPPNISCDELSSVLKNLKKNNIAINEVNIGVRENTGEADELLDKLDIEAKANVYAVCGKPETVPEIRILLK